jgi:hypothetical protein
VATIALWHLGVTAVLAGALSSVILVQSIGAALRRLRPGARRDLTVPLHSRLTVEPRTVRVTVLPSTEKAPAMASAAGAR